MVIFMNEILEKMMRAEELSNEMKNIKKEIPSSPSDFAHKLMSTSTTVDLNLLRSIGAKECSFFNEIGVVTYNFINGTVKVFIDGKYNGFEVPYRYKRMLGSDTVCFIFEDIPDHIGDYGVTVCIALSSNDKLKLREFKVEGTW